MQIKANLSISRRSNDSIVISVQDEASRATFLVLQMTPADFSMALTGLAYVDATICEVKGLDVVGKNRVAERRKATCPLSCYTNRDEIVSWLVKNCQEEGWQIDTYLGSQGSIVSIGEETILNYTVFKYVSEDS